MPKKNDMALSSEEKKYIIAYLTETAEKLENAIATFTKSEDYKPSPEEWSLANVVEHLALTEKSFRRALDFALAQPAMSESEAAAQRKSDNYVRKGNAGRVTKVKAPERVSPSGTLNVAEAWVQFSAQRAENIQFLQDSQQDFRLHFWTHPFFGAIDGFQVLITMAAHLERHLLQIEELNQL
jgi:hypothetical protein